MEIELRILYRPKRIWYLVLFFLCTVAMETVCISPGDALQPLNDKETTFKSSDDIVHPFKGINKPNANENITHQNTQNSENATMNSTSTDDECFDFINNTIDATEECQAFFNVPPPFFEHIPPPPLPPFLKDLELLFQASWKHPELILHYPEKQKESSPPLEEGACPLCQWSRGNNDTLALILKEPNDKKMEEDPKSLMVWVLVGVAVLSATIGAVLMGLFLRCRRKDVINICSKTATDPTSNVPDRNLSEVDRKKSELSVFQLFFRSCVKRRAPRTSLDPYRAESIQNTYSESPYINADASSTLYAEINTPSDSSTTEGVQMCYPDSYSEVPDPLDVSLGVHVAYNKMSKVSKVPKMKATPESVYSNSAYIVSEASSEPNESSGGSTSTPSSAYYSDVSTSLEVHVNKRRKKKRKNDEKIFKMTPSQKLKNHYLPTFRPQQLHSLCMADEQYVPKFQEQPQNIYCSSNLVQSCIQRPNSKVNISTRDSGSSLVQNSVRVPPISLLNSDVMMKPLINDTASPSKLSSIDGVPLCLHFGNICSEQGCMCIPQSHNHHIFNNTSGQSKLNEHCSDHGQVNEKLIPAFQYFVPGNISHMEDPTKGNVYSAQGQMNENILLRPSQCRELYPLSKQKENLCTDQCHNNENVYFDFHQVNENGIFSQDYQKGEICSGQNKINGNFYPENGQNIGNVYYVQDGNVYSSQDQIGNIEYYHHQNREQTFPDTKQTCDNICTEQITENMCSMRYSNCINGVSEMNNSRRSYSGKGNICGRFNSGEDQSNKIKNLRSSSVDTSNNCIEEFNDNICRRKRHVKSSDLAQCGPRSDNIYFERDQDSEYVYSDRNIAGQIYLNNTFKTQSCENGFSGQGQLCNNFSEQNHSCKKVHTTQDQVCDGHFEQSTPSDNLNNQISPCNKSYSGQGQLSGTSEDQGPNRQNHCGKNEETSVEKFTEGKNHSSLACPQTTEKTDIQSFSPTPSEYI